MKKILSILLICWALFPIHSVLAASADTTALPVLSRGHIQDLGDYPADGSWVASPNRIGTVGQSKRIEGFELKADDSLPTDLELRYNVHVQNIGWLYDEDDPTSWAKNGDYAGTRGDSLRIEAIKIVLLDAAGNKASGYHIRYQGHVQNIGDLPADSEQWFSDGEQLGTVGSSLRLEALKLEIVKDAATGTDLSAYTALIKEIDRLTEADYSKASWANLQSVLNKHAVTEQSTATEVTEAVKAIETAIQKLENLTQATIYDKGGSYGPSSSSETISQNVVITASGVTLQNLTIDGNLIIDEAVGDGDVTLSNVNVSGELRVRGGGQNSIHISGGKYAKILVEQAPNGGVRIVATGLDGVPVVLSENAAGETLILEGSFDSLTIGAPDAVVKTQGQTSIKTVDVTAEAKNAAISLGSTTTVANLAIAAPTKVTGTGAISKAEITADNVSFEKAPGSYTVDPVVVIPPVIPTPPSGGGSSGGGGGYTPPAKINLIIATPATVTTAKTYDGSTSANITGQPAVTGIVASDDVTVTATANYDNKKAGSDKTITVSYSLSGTAASKYNPLAATTIKGEITQKPLSNATTAIAKEFDGTTTLNTDITENLGQLASDTLTITRTATYQNSSGKTDAIEVGTDKPVTCSYTLSGADAVNYLAPADHPATGTITKRTLTVTAASLNINKNKIYDGTTDVFNLSGHRIEAGNNAISVDTGVAAEPIVIVTAAAAYDSQNAGNNRTIAVSYSISSGSADRRYQIAAKETISGASITARPLTIAANQVPTPVAKAYDSTADVFTAANNTDKIYNMTVTPGNIATADAGKVTVTATATYDGGKDVGTAKPITIRYTLDGEAAGNYQPLPDDHSKTADITPLTLNTGSVTEKTKEYDGTSTATKLNIPLSCSNNNGVFQAEAGKTLSSKIVADYYTDNEFKTKCSQVGDNLYIKYTISLDGASAGNYVFEGGEKTLTATTNGGSITPKTLTITPPAIKTSRPYDGTSKVYDPDGKEISSYAVAASQISGLAVGESVAVTANLSSNDKDAGEQTVTISYSTSDNSGNYLIANHTITVTITPLPLTVDTSKLPAIAVTRKYDATTDVYLANSTTKLSDYLVDANAVSGLINNDVVTVKATANYDNKDVGENKPITITYSLSEEAAKNYLAPAPDTSKKAAITPRILGYTNVNLDTIKKYKSGDSSVTVTYAGVDPSGNPDNGTDAIAHTAGTNTQEDVNLTTYSADYYDGDQKTSAVGSNYDIKLSGSLTGNHASNYIMGDYTYSSKGQILDANAIISTPYNSTAWTPAGNLTAPADVTNFKLFYAKQNGATTFYGYDSTGQIYSSTDLSTWITGEQVSLDGSKKLIGVDNSWGPLAIDSNCTKDDAGNKYYQIYSWSNGWDDIDPDNPEITTTLTPINPTYYSDNVGDYLICQDNNNNNNAIKCVISGSDQAPIDASSGPTLPGGFTNSLLVYNGGNNLTLYAY